MATVEIDLVFPESFDREIASEVRADAVDAARDIGLALESEVKMIMTTSTPSGRRYVRTKDGKMHTASAPGQAPAVDMGQYRASFTSYVEVEGNIVSAVWGSYLWKTRGRRLEFGGRDSRGGYIAPRPHVRRALAQAAPSIENRLRGM